MPRSGLGGTPTTSVRGFQGNGSDGDGSYGRGPGAMSQGGVPPGGRAGIPAGTGAASVAVSSAMPSGNGGSGLPGYLGGGGNGGNAGGTSGPPGASFASSSTNIGTGSSPGGTGIGPGRGSGHGHPSAMPPTFPYGEDGGDSPDGNGTSDEGYRGGGTLVMGGAYSRRGNGFGTGPASSGSDLRAWSAARIHDRRGWGLFRRRNGPEWDWGNKP